MIPSVKVSRQDMAVVNMFYKSYIGGSCSDICMHVYKCMSYISDFQSQTLMSVLRVQMVVLRIAWTQMVVTCVHVILGIS